MSVVPRQSARVSGLLPCGADGPSCGDWGGLAAGLRGLPLRHTAQVLYPSGTSYTAQPTSEPVNTTYHTAGSRHISPADQPPPRLTSQRVKGAANEALFLANGDGQSQPEG